MPLRIVQSKQNARLKELRRALAHPPRNGGGLAGIEGPNLIGEALRAGLRVECVFVAEGAESLLDGLGLPPETEILLLPRALLDSALTTEAPQPIAALIQPPDWTWAGLLGDHQKTAPLFVVLAGLQDQSRHDSAFRRGLWRQRRSQLARNRERVEPQGGARLGWQRLPGSAACRQRGRVLYAPARGRCDHPDHVDKRRARDTARSSNEPGWTGRTPHRQ